MLVADLELVRLTRTAPMTDWSPTTTADRLRRDFDTDNLVYVYVNVIRIHRFA
ncbi:MAG: hypothetical protein QOC75_1700 [Pseudonocardiales bacterium]|nr:hypothetical protein [Pseudonocardiales bacterium]MDT7644700.1 hypothetical protein [Pseudonocardiales bacterium]